MPSGSVDLFAGGSSLLYQINQDREKRQRQASLDTSGQPKVLNYFRDNNYSTTERTSGPTIFRSGFAEDTTLLSRTPTKTTGGPTIFRSGYGEATTSGSGAFGLTTQATQTGYYLDYNIYGQFQDEPNRLIGRAEELVSYVTYFRDSSLVSLVPFFIFPGSFPPELVDNISYKGNTLGGFDSLVGSTLFPDGYVLHGQGDSTFGDYFRLFSDASGDFFADGRAFFFGEQRFSNDDTDVLEAANEATVDIDFNMAPLYGNSFFTIDVDFGSDLVVKLAGAAQPVNRGMTQNVEIRTTRDPFTAEELTNTYLIGDYSLFLRFIQKPSRLSVQVNAGSGRILFFLDGSLFFTVEEVAFDLSSFNGTDRHIGYFISWWGEPEKPLSLDFYSFRFTPALLYTENHLIEAIYPRLA